MHIDHVLFATHDLDGTAARFAAEHGLAATGGGRHTGLGTENRIIPLGGGYIELIAVADRAEAERSALGRTLAERIRERGEGLMGWVVAVEDVAAEATRTGAELSTIERAGLSAQLAGVATAMGEPSLPFFIRRDPGSADPGEGADHGGITWVEVGGDTERLRWWLGGADLPLRVIPSPPAPPALLGVGIGDRELR